MFITYKDIICSFFYKEKDLYGKYGNNMEIMVDFSAEAFEFVRIRRECGSIDKHTKHFILKFIKILICCSRKKKKSNLETKIKI